MGQFVVHFFHGFWRIEFNRMVILVLNGLN